MARTNLGRGRPDVSVGGRHERRPEAPFVPGVNRYFDQIQPGRVRATSEPMIRTLVSLDTIVAAGLTDVPSKRHRKLRPGAS
jgi:hypothetical protein